MMRAYQVSYEDLADPFDRGRTLSKAKEALWLNLFEKHLGLCRISRVLDVGCGTGRFSRLIAKQFGCFVVGIDPSVSMQAKAKAKCLQRTEWLRGRGEAMPFSEGVFDVCLASQVIQHFQNKRQALAEIHRVLGLGGKVGIRLSSHAQLQTILDYRFFPSGLQVERDRLPDVHIVRDMLRVAGFNRRVT